jgi:hypothetical protein
LRLKKSLLSATVAFIANQLLAQTPALNYAVPAAIAPGKTTKVMLHGANLSGATNLWTSFPANATFLADSDSTPVDAKTARCQFSVPPDVPPGICALRVATTNGVSSLQLLMIDDLPSIVESGQNNSMTNAQQLIPPVAIDGACDELSFDYYKFSAKKGQRISFEVAAQRLGSRLDPVMRLLDAKGRELEYCDDDGVGADSRFTHRFAASGEFFLEIRDVNYQGGPQYRYRLRVGNFPLATVAFPLGGRQGTIAKLAFAGPSVERVKPVTVSLPTNTMRLSVGLKFPGAQGSSFVNVTSSGMEEVTESEPNDSPAYPSKIGIPVVINGRFAAAQDRDLFQFDAQKDQRLVFHGKTRSLGSPCDLFMQLQKLDGSKLVEAKLTGADEGTITNTFKEAGTYFLMLEELNQRGGADLAYRVEVEALRPGFALSVETEKVEATNGGTFELKVLVTRRDYDGPIALSLDGVGDGFELEDLVIAEKKTNTVLKAKVPSRFALGQMMNFSVTGKARIGNEDVTATASTMPALHALFPNMPYPPAELDGLICLGIKSPTAKSTEEKPSGKKRK